MTKETGISHKANTLREIGIMKRNRLPALLLAFAMVFTCMPVMAYADFSEPDYNVDYVDCGSVRYYAQVNGACIAMVYDDASGDLKIPSSVKFSDGKTRTVDAIYGDSPDQTISCSIPSSVDAIYSVGLASFDYYDDETDKQLEYTVKPGYVIYGTKGSYAEAYAKKYGIKFRDLAAEAAAKKAEEEEAARQGTRDKAIPKVKIKKAVAAKKAITVKWKKLSKKQLKKSKASKYEIWVCPNGKFGPKDTIMKTAGKTKSSFKVRGLKKGKTYRVKLRAIRYVKGKKLVGAWSAVKKVKVEK